MNPNYRHVGIVDLPAQQNFPSKKNNMRLFGQTIEPNHRKMLSDLRVGAFCPRGSLAIVNLAQIGIPIEKVVSRWRS